MYPSLSPSQIYGFVKPELCREWSIYITLHMHGYGTRISLSLQGSAYLHMSEHVNWWHLCYHIWIYLYDMRVIKQEDAKHDETHRVSCETTVNWDNSLLQER